MRQELPLSRFGWQGKGVMLRALLQLARCSDHGRPDRRNVASRMGQGGQLIGAKRARVFSAECHAATLPEPTHGFPKPLRRLA
jgi:hypothetical protein